MSDWKNPKDYYVDVVGTTRATVVKLKLNISKTIPSQLNANQVNPYQHYLYSDKQGMMNSSLITTFSHNCM